MVADGLACRAPGRRGSVAADAAASRRTRQRLESRGPVGGGAGNLAADATASRRTRRDSVTADGVRPAAEPRTGRRSRGPGGLRTDAAASVRPEGLRDRGFLPAGADLPGRATGRGGRPSDTPEGFRGVVWAGGSGSGSPLPTRRAVPGPTPGPGRSGLGLDPPDMPERARADIQARAGRGWTSTHPTHRRKHEPTSRPGQAEAGPRPTRHAGECTSRHPPEGRMVLRTT